MEKALVILSHGSRSEQFKESFEAVVKQVEDKNLGIPIFGANMELCEPSLEEVVKDLAANNEDLKTIAVIPFFLFEGIHIKKDIPEILDNLSKEYESIDFVMGKPLGADPILAEILVKRAKEVL